MKQLLIIPLFFHMGSGQWFKKVDYPTVDLMIVRLEPWTINLQRVISYYPMVDLQTVRSEPWAINLQRAIYYTDTCYAFQFRDQSIMNSVAMKTLDLETMEQLKYFKEGLITLKKGANGDVAVYRNYSIKKVGTKKENSWYILSFGSAVTNFQEPQLNRMVYIIDTFINSQY